MLVYLKNHGLKELKAKRFSLKAILKCKFNQWCAGKMFKSGWGEGKR